MLYGVYNYELQYVIHTFMVIPPVYLYQPNPNFLCCYTYMYSTPLTWYRVTINITNIGNISLCISCSTALKTQKNGHPTDDTLKLQWWSCKWEYTSEYNINDMHIGLSCLKLYMYVCGTVLMLAVTYYYPHSFIYPVFVLRSLAHSGTH